MRSLHGASGVLVLLCCIAAIGVPVKFSTIDRGQQSNIDDAREVTARTATEWTALWKQHAGDRPRPAVDFSTSTVMGVFLGSRPTGGYDVEITGIEKEGSDLIVTWREQRPAKDAMLSQVLTMPFHLVSIPRHTGAVKFKKAAS